MKHNNSNTMFTATVAVNGCWTFSAMPYCCSDPLSAHGNTRSDQLAGRKRSETFHDKNKCQHGASKSLSVLFYVGNELGHKTQGCLFKQTDLFHRKLGKVEQESLFDKLNSLNCYFKAECGPVTELCLATCFRSVEECNCRSFIHHCQQTRFLRDALDDLSVSNSAPP